MNSLTSLKTPQALQKLEWVLDPAGYMEKAAQQYPDIFAAEIVGFGNSLVFISHPQALQEILTSDASGAVKRRKFFASSEQNKILQPLIGDYSVIMIEGDRHKKRRQLLLPPFHGDRMRAYGQLICELTAKAFDQLPLNQPFSARSAAQKVSLQVILQAVFGIYEGERHRQLQKILTTMSELFNSPLTSSFLFFSFLQKDWGTWSPWGRFLRDRAHLDQLIYAEIAERRAHPDPTRVDILSLLMSAHDEAGNLMSDQELRDELVTLVLAGHETTATAIAWALYWVHHLPPVRAKLLQELATLEDSPDPMSIARLPYLTAVCNETLRIHPVAMLTFPRVVQEPIQLLGYDLAPGTVLAGCIYLLHQREDLYPEPKQFRPERFLERQFSSFEFLPFGGGARRCIGEALALFEMKLVLATILSRYQLALADRKPEKPRRRGVTLAPSNGVSMIKERSSSRPQPLVEATTF